MELIDWVRPEFLPLKGYSACKSADSFNGKVAKLDANENPHGSVSAAVDAVRALDNYAIYPDASQTLLKQIAADYCNVSPDNVAWGAGSSQLIDYVIRLFVDRDQEMIVPSPSFPQYTFYSAVNGNKIVNVPRDENFEIDVEAIKNAITPKTKLIMIANPNNPTGNVTPLNIIEEVLKLGIPTVSDEAYYEFAGVTALPLMEKYPNLMVLRSFSKFAALAGIRAGYGIFPKAVADRVHAIRDPYNVNVCGVAAVKASYEHKDELLANCKKVAIERERLFNELQQFPFLKVYPSQANFILCLVSEDHTSAELQAFLEQYNVLSRCFNGVGLKNTIRFSIGLPDEDDMLIEALKKFK